ncbi:hypothetical protein SDC9_99824 [bioreactor metagenome]|uniref:Uncharacterized protein n=1 Tax=bioreactor metagenome TaxID=1076179 RepID=A0A645AIV8_9ZZZZ
MHSAIAQFTVMQIGFFGSFSCQFGYSGYCLAFFLGILNLLKHDFGCFVIDVQEVIQLLFHEIADEFTNRRTIRTHVFGA